MLGSRTVKFKGALALVGLIGILGVSSPTIANAEVRLVNEQEQNESKIQEDLDSKYIKQLQEDYQEGSSPLVVNPKTEVLSPTLGYFNLKVKPDTKVETFYRIENISDKEQKVLFKVDYAGMYEDIEPVYDNKLGYNRDKTIPLKIKDFVDYKKSVTIKPKSGIDYKVTYNMPKEEFNGEINLGLSIEVDKPSDKDKSDKTNKDSTETSDSRDYTEIGIKDEKKYRHVVATILRENDKYVDPEFKVNKARIEGKTLKFNLQNVSTGELSEPLVIVKLKTETGKVLMEEIYNEHAFLPNSNIDLEYKIDDNVNLIGKYTVEVETTGNQATQKQIEDDETPTYPRQNTTRYYKSEDSDKNSKFLHHGVARGTVKVAPSTDNIKTSFIETVTDINKLPWLILILLVIILIIYAVRNHLKKEKEAKSKDVTQTSEDVTPEDK